MEIMNGSSEWHPSFDGGAHKHESLLDISHVVLNEFSSPARGCVSRSECVMGSTLLPCQHLHEINDTIARCVFVRASDDCHDDEGFISYIDFVYCSSGSTYLPLAALGLWLVVLFTFLGITADDFLCPALVVISKILRLSENVAGVTLVAFGNGAPDIISSLTGIQQARPTLVIGELLGAGTFVTTVVAGSVLFCTKFHLNQEAFIRDSLFYLAASYWAFYLFHRQNITLWDAVGFICMYIVYISVVLVGHIYTKSEDPDNCIIVDPGTTENSTEILTDEQDENCAEALMHASTSSQRPGQLFGHYQHAVHQMLLSSGEFRRTRSRTSSITSNTSGDIITEVRTHRPSYGTGQQYLAVPEMTPNHESSSHITESTDENTPLLVKNDNDVPLKPFQELLWHILPCTYSEFHQMGFAKKCLTLITFPVQFTLLITVPVVDFENDKNNWCRLLNSFHCTSSLLVIVFFTGLGNFQLFCLPVYFWTSIFGVCMTLIVFFTTTYDYVPKYHNAFGCLGFFAAGMWTYGVCQELLSLLKTMGIVFGLSDAVLGLTVLAWGNSIGDLVTNTTVAKQGYPMMALSACFGGQLLNLLLGIGLPFTVLLSSTTDHHLHLDSDRVVPILYGGLASSLVVTSVCMLYTRYRSTRVNACILFAVYAIFLVIAILAAASKI